MRSMWKKVVLSAALMPITAFAADNTLGTWKLNIKQSKFNAGAPKLRNLETIRVAVNKPFYGNDNQVLGNVGVTESSMGRAADGSQYGINYTAGYNADSYLVEGNATSFLFSLISVTQIDANTLRLSVQQGTYMCSGLTYVSNNGKIMTTTLDCGTRGKMKLVYEKIK